MSSIETDH